MRISWEENDIKPGQQVGKPTVRERLLIGFVANNADDKRFFAVSLSDGMAYPAMSRKELATWLTEGGWIPAALLP